MSSRSFASATSAWPYGLMTVGYGGSRNSGIAALQSSDQLRFGRRGELRGKLDEVSVRVGGKAVKSVGGRGPIDQNVGFVPLTRLGQGLEHGVDVVPVDVHRRPAERLPLGRDRLDRGDRVHGAVYLGVVGVEQHGELAEPVVAGEHRR